MPKDSLSITDNRTGKTYEVPITDGIIRAMDLRQIKTGPADFGLMTYDPALLNTAICRSSITYIDGDNGILMYRGYPIEQLAEKSTYLEVAYLLLNGELPNQTQLADFDQPDHHPHLRPREHQDLHRGLPLRRPPDGHAGSTVVGALSTFYPEAKNSTTRAVRRLQMTRLDRQDADHRGLLLPPQHGHALRLPGQRPVASPATSWRWSRGSPR